MNTPPTNRQANLPINPPTNKQTSRLLAPGTNDKRVSAEDDRPLGGPDGRAWTHNFT
jgi:hypothetical protein